MIDDSNGGGVNPDEMGASAYPADGPVEVMGFDCTDDLYLTRGIEAVQVRCEEDADYIVARRCCAAIKLRLPDDRESTVPIEVPCGLLTDLSPVPRWDCWLMGNVGGYLEAAKSIAGERNLSVGAVLSELARRGLRPETMALRKREGFPVFDVSRDSTVLTLDRVKW